jgi:hypothetical protein
MKRSLIALTTLTLVALAAPAPAAPARIYALKNHTYVGTGEVPSEGYSAVVTIKIGNDPTRVKKLVAKISCAEGTAKFSHRNLEIDDRGNIDWDERWEEDFFGQFTSRHKVTRGSVQAAYSQPCSTYVVDFVAKG